MLSIAHSSSKCYRERLILDHRYVKQDTEWGKGRVGESYVSDGIEKIKPSKVSPKLNGKT